MSFILLLSLPLILRFLFSHLFLLYNIHYEKIYYILIILFSIILILKLTKIERKYSL